MYDLSGAEEPDAILRISVTCLKFNTGDDRCIGIIQNDLVNGIMNIDGEIRQYAVLTFLLSGLFKIKNQI